MQEKSITLYSLFDIITTDAFYSQMIGKCPSIVMSLKFSKFYIRSDIKRNQTLLIAYG